MDSIERIQGLHADLVAFSESRLPNIDRLRQELADSTKDFQKLLDKSSQNNASRETLASGKITIDEQSFGVNEKFKDLTLQVASSLDIDELEAARLVYEAQKTQPTRTESLVEDVIGNFHDHRDLLLQSLRITLHRATDPDPDDLDRELFQDAVNAILEVKPDAQLNKNGSAYTRKCLQAMDDIEKWEVKIGEHIDSRAMLGQPSGLDVYNTLDFQKASLFKQHEALGAVVAYLFRGGHTISDDVRKLLDVPKRWNRLDLDLVHYLPGFAAAIRHYGSPDQTRDAAEANALHTAFAQQKPQDPTTPVSPFHALLSLWWVAEYGGWLRELPEQVPVNVEELSQLVRVALKGDALELVLSICTGMTNNEWQPPARQELVALMLSESEGLTIDGDHTSPFFRLLLMESLEAFAEAWITNLPDSIRQLKNEEDDERLRYITAMQDGLSTSTPRATLGALYLESFLLIISFAYEGREAALEQFWQDPESNLFGFLQWASKRQTVPRVSAFCEMLCSISEGPESSAAAHRFLLDETASTASRTRRTPSMNYHQMFAELELYSRKVHERSSATQMPHLRKVLPTDLNEVESPIMLSSYLRLIAHMCRQYSVTRQFIFEYTSPGHGLTLPQALLCLSSGSVPSYLRANVFTTLEALLTDKSTETNDYMWNIVDQWAAAGYTAFDPTLAKGGQVTQPNMQTLQHTLGSISLSFDQYSAFVLLLRKLVVLPGDRDASAHQIAYPDDLGSTYRMPGLTPYIDYVCGQLFTKKTHELPDEVPTRQFRFYCLDFIASCLETFDEKYVATFAQSKTAIENRPTSMPTASDYAIRHPMARTMEWLLNDDVNQALIASTHQPLGLLESSLPGSPLQAGLQRSLDIYNMALDLQPTYQNLVQPLVRNSGRVPALPTSAINCLEDGVTAHPQLISNLCSYVAIEHSSLVLKSLALLQRLSCSRKLNSPVSLTGNPRTKVKRLVDMLGTNASADLVPVSVALVSHLQTNLRELEAALAAPDYVIKDGLFSYMNASLALQHTLPDVAHLLLGFSRIGNSLISTPNGLLENGTSVLHAIIDLLQDYPTGDEQGMLSWLIHIRAAAIQVLRHLWVADLSTTLTVLELRKCQFLRTQLMAATVVSQYTLWDGCTIEEPAFWFNSSADTVAELLAYRTHLNEYVALEVASVFQSGYTAVQKSTMSTLLGKSRDLDGSDVTHSTVFDLFDFADIDVPSAFELPPLQYHHEVDVDFCLTRPSDEGPLLYDLGMLREVLQQHSSAVFNRDASKGFAENDQINLETESIMAYITAKNRWIIVRHTRMEAFQSLSKAIVTILDCCPMEAGAKIQFILRLLTVFLPKLDAAIIDEGAETIELARIADAIMMTLAHVTTEKVPGRTDNLVTERLFQLFRSCVEGIHHPASDPVQREIFYHACSQYLDRISRPSDTNARVRRNAIDCVRSAGLPLINIMSDDAGDGAEGCKLAALNCLGLLASLSRSERSPFVVEALVGANAIEVLLEPVKRIAADFQDAEPKHRAYLLDIVQARLLLLLQISRTREGAIHLLEAGLLSAVRDSLLFRADPDLGLENDNNEALHHYYELVLSVLRLINSTFISRGIQNEQCQYLMRTFLQDYRLNMVGSFKRANGVNGRANKKSQVVLDQIVNAFTALATMCSFVDVEQDEPVGGVRKGGFA